MCRDSITEAKQRDRERHQRAYEQWLADGNTPTECPPCTMARPLGVVPESEMESRRRGNRAGLATMKARRMAND